MQLLLASLLYRRRPGSMLLREALSKKERVYEPWQEAGSACAVFSYLDDTAKVSVFCFGLPRSDSVTSFNQTSSAATTSPSSEPCSLDGGAQCHHRFLRMRRHLLWLECRASYGCSKREQNSSLAETPCTARIYWPSRPDNSESCSR